MRTLVVPSRLVASRCGLGLAVFLAAIAGAAPLEAPVSALWTAVPLRAWAARVSAIAGRPIIVDRRLDPDFAVTRDCRGEPLGDVLAVVAEQAGGAVEPLGAWIRIAPAAEAGRETEGERARTAEIGRLPAAARTAIAARGDWSWPDGARPRDLIAAAATDAGLKLRGLDRVPHDHLPGAALAALTLAERLDLLLAHYDLRVAWSAADGNLHGEIVPLPAAARAAVPGRVPRPVAPPRPKPRASERFTLKLEAPLDEAIAALAPRLGLVAEIDRDSFAARGILPGEIVRANVTDATREHLLDALVAPLGLRWQIDGDRLLIDAPP